MSEIKSAREIAEEKLKDLGEATEDERLSWKYVPEGEKLAAQYMRESIKLVAEMGKYEGKAKDYVIKGFTEVIAGNIGLPDSDVAKKNNKRAMDALKLVKTDKVALENVFSQLRRIFEHYQGQGEQQRRQAYEALKAQFEAQLAQALQQQLGTTPGFKIDVEKQPQFQAEWRKQQLQLDAQYNNLLNELRHELTKID